MKVRFSVHQARKKGTIMKDDGFFITRSPQRGLDWTCAAVRFTTTRDQFLVQVPSPAAIVGIWWAVCLPFKGLTNRPVDDFTEEEIERIELQTHELIRFTRPRRYDCIAGVEKLFKKLLEYPPYALNDNWDGHTVARRQWAEEMFKHSGIRV